MLPKHTANNRNLKCVAGWELFMIISVLVLMIILPINLTSGNIDKLNGQAYDPESVSQYMYWLPAPPSPGSVCRV